MIKNEQIDYADAQCELGHKYRTGDGVKKDIKKAIYHYRNAEEKDDLIAHWYLCKLEREQDDRRLKYIIMPAILCCLIATLFVIHSNK